MGLGIDFIFADGSTYHIGMCYSSFHMRVMTLDEMTEYDFTDHDGVYTGKQLDFLIHCLLRSGYLDKDFSTRPIRAEFN